MEGKLLWEVKGKQVVVRDKFTIEELDKLVGLNFVVAQLLGERVGEATVKLFTPQGVEPEKKVFYHRRVRNDSVKMSSTDRIMRAIAVHPRGITSRKISKESRVPWATVRAYMPIIIKSGRVRVSGHKKRHEFIYSLNDSVAAPKYSSKKKGDLGVDITNVLEGKRLTGAQVARSLNIPLNNAVARLYTMTKSGEAARVKVDNPSSNSPHKQVYLYWLSKTTLPESKPVPMVVEDLVSSRAKRLGIIVPTHAMEELRKYPNYTSILGLAKDKQFYYLSQGMVHQLAKELKGGAPAAAVEPAFVEAFIEHALRGEGQITGKEFADFMKQYGVEGDAALAFWREVFIPKFVARLSPVYEAKLDLNTGSVHLILRNNRGRTK